MILYIDAASGASGDKLLAALLEVAEEVGQYSLEGLLIDLATVVPEAVITTRRVTRGGVSGSLLSVECAHEPHHRHWRDIRLMLESARLPRGALDRALKAFALLAEAEASVHGTDVDDVHFHEVGATDSLVDMLGVSLILDALGVTRVVCSPVAVGSGEVATSHGVLSVPAPATAELLRGVPVCAGAAPGEATTPTGAALLLACVDAWGPMPPLVVESIGYGAGSRDPEGTPNVLRIIAGRSPALDRDDDEGIGSAASEASYVVEGLVLLSTNVDHVSPEAVAYAADMLLVEGALDVWQTPIVMKKGRLAVELSVLAEPLRSDALAGRMHELTGTLGVRRTWVERTVAPREQIEVETPWGPCRFKVGIIGGATIVRPEHDDVARMSRQTETTYLETVRVLREYGERRLGDG